ncbi:VanZ family protein [Bradyrhizobium sp. JYMT SZCCT0428]|uniref:VanZ family protein n=1 Tax=Bradyrhizobium sp. JYMT SZCCT0428 TaxID=2807673 RepID=UPI001BA980A7|nr:VanZ family protein [Bradyrhizobium sp. JYMT SZCCT0428]MBR1156896.1 VanZ family protein [Bradyrhizobium sp. JYMT SZCCT0428]
MLLAAICGLIILWLTLAAHTRPHIFPYPGFDRLIAFAMLSFLSAFAFPKHLPTVLLLSIVAAIGSEMLQFLRPTRDPRIIDGIMKVIGASAGVGCFALAKLPFKRRPA